MAAHDSATTEQVPDKRMPELPELLIHHGNIVTWSLKIIMNAKYASHFESLRLKPHPDDTLYRTARGLPYLRTARTGTYTTYIGTL